MTAKPKSQLRRTHEPALGGADLTDSKPQSPSNLVQGRRGVGQFSMLEQLFREFDPAAAELIFGPNANSDEIAASIAYRSFVDEKFKKGIDAIKQWKAWSGTTAHQCFLQNFADVPFDERPSADEVRQASPRFYNTLAQHQHRYGQTIGDLFPIDPDARGGAKAKAGGELTYDVLFDRLQRVRERDRLRKARARSRAKNDPS